MQIFHALGPVVSGLTGGVANPLEDILRREICESGQRFGEQLGLVKPALALSGRMKRHWNEEIEVAVAETGIAQSFAQPEADRMAEMALPRVLELMNEPANQTAAAVGGDRGISGKDPPHAIRAN